MIFSFSENMAKESERESKRQRDKETEAGQESHHVEIGADFDSSGQVPHNTIPIMPR